MNKKLWPAGTFSLVAGVVFLTGLGLAVSSLMHYPSVCRDIRNVIRDTEQINALAAEYAALETAIKPFAALQYETLPDPESLARNAFGVESIASVSQTREPGGADYVVNRVELQLKTVSFRELPRFIRMAESLHPPLRLTGCTLHASKTEPGTGTAMLTCDRIER